MKKTEELLAKYAEKSIISKEQYEKAKSKLSETEFKKQYVFQKGSAPSDPDKYLFINLPKPKEIESLISTDILKELQELKKAQMDGNRHLKTLKFIGWFFVAATAIALAFIIKFTIALNSFMDSLTTILNGLSYNLSSFNGFMDNLSTNLNQFVDNLSSFNDFMANLSVNLNEFVDNLAALNSFLSNLNAWFL